MDTSRAALARAAYLAAEGTTEVDYRDEEALLLDLMTLLVLVRGPECTTTDVRDAWLVAELRWGLPPAGSVSRPTADPEVDDELTGRDLDSVHRAALTQPGRDKPRACPTADPDEPAYLDNLVKAVEEVGGLARLLAELVHLADTSPTMTDTEVRRGLYHLAGQAEERVSVQRSLDRGGEHGA